jgi:PAS domain S-box-containing protein
MVDRSEAVTMALPSPLVVASALAGGVTAVLGVASWRRRDAPGGTAFAFLMVGATVWSLAYAAALLVFDPAVRVVFELPIEVGKALIAPGWLLFALGYTGRGQFLTRRFVAAVMVVPVVTLALTATNDAHHLLWRNYRVVEVAGAATAAYEPGAWYYVHAAYGYVLIGLGLALVLGMVLSRGDPYRDQVVALVVGSAAPTVANVARTFRLGPYPTVDFTPVALSLTAVMFGYALLRLELFGFSPATRRLGRRAAIDDVGVGVAVVDGQDRVVELNAEAESLLGRTTSEASRTPLADLVADGANPDGGDGDDAWTEGGLVDIDDERGRRRYEVTASPVTSADGAVVGRTVSFQDVTERERRRQRLEVLNRVLRHNLRNELTVISVHADDLAGRLDGTAADQAGAVASSADDLAGLAERAQEVERVMEAGDRPAERVDIAALVRAAVGGVRETHPDATVAVDAPEAAWVETKGGVLRPVVANLVENAVEHGGPPVEVRVATTATGVTITVADDGPGIPAAELAAIEAGAETDLTHGSGLGLWLVKWGVDILGGDLSVETDGGTVVTVAVRAPE